MIAHINEGKQTFFYALLLGMLLIICGIVIHMRTYDDYYIPIQALVKKADCEMIIVNNTTNKFHCTLSLEYNFNDKLIKNDYKTINKFRYHNGDIVDIYINKENPIEIINPIIPARLTSYSLSISGSLIIICAFITIFLKVV